MSDPVSLPGRDAIKLAIELASLGVSITSLFIAICVAFGGWFITNITIKSTPRFSGLRWTIALIFTTSAGGVALGALRFFERAGKAMDLAQLYADGEQNENRRELLYNIYQPEDIYIIFATFASSILLIMGLILIYRK